MSDLELLVHCMRERTPVLLLGAGFSIGAVNGKGEELPVGRSLAGELYKYFYIEKPIPIVDDEYLKQINNENLREICTILRSEKRLDERNQYFVDIFSGCQTGSDPYQSKITNYNWKEIFTLNIDDLVENIYKQKNLPLDVWNHSHGGSYGSNDVPKLIKLHGCVTDKDEGFVFDDIEYPDFTAKQNYLIKAFSHAYVRNDVIMLGTEFQENDLQIAINIYKEAGFNDSGKYFFITPSLNNVALKNFINDNPNFFWIKMTTKEFLEYITEHVINSKNMRDTLKEQGVIFLDEVKLDTDHNSDIYNGVEPQYKDFLFNWDIYHPVMEGIVEEFIKSSKTGILSLHGKSYVGKTCVAKRALVDFKKNNYFSIELIRGSHHVYSNLKEYLKTFPNGSKVAMLIEDAAFQYNSLIRFIKQSIPNIAQLVIITVDITENHKNKNYILRDYENVKAVFISEEINWKYARNIFNKLNEKNRLNNYLTLLPTRSSPTNYKNKDTIMKHIKKLNDIVEVLHYSSEGRGFEDYYSTWLEDHNHKHYIDYLIAMCALGELGVTWVPNQIIPNLIPDKRRHFSLNEFAKQYPEVVYVFRGRTRLCRRRILHSIFGKYNPEIILEVLRQVALQSMGLFREGVENEYSEIFQKSLRVKRIRNKSLLPKEHIYSLLKSLEGNCSSISYYWIQFGIVSQLDEKFEDSNNHFLYAQRLQPNSYQVKHALAKNWMERGLYELKHHVSAADQHFQRGKTDMSTLIDSEQYKNAFRYSIHVYVNLLLKYYKEKEEILPMDECYYIQKKLQLLMSGDIDSKVKEIIVKYNRYCHRNNLRQFTSGLEGIAKIHPKFISDEEDYEIDQLYDV